MPGSLGRSGLLFTFYYSLAGSGLRQGFGQARRSACGAKAAHPRSTFDFAQVDPEPVEGSHALRRSPLDSVRGDGERVEPSQTRYPLFLALGPHPQRSG